MVRSSRRSAAEGREPAPPGCPSGWPSTRPPSIFDTRSRSRPAAGGSSRRFGSASASELQLLLYELDERPQHTHRGVRGAGAVEQTMRLFGYPAVQLVDEPGLSHARLAGDHDGGRRGLVEARPSCPQDARARRSVPDEGGASGAIVRDRRVPPGGRAPSRPRPVRARPQAEGTERDHLEPPVDERDRGDGVATTVPGSPTACSRADEVDRLAHRHRGPGRRPELADHGQAAVDARPGRRAAAPRRASRWRPQCRERRSAPGGVVVVGLRPPEAEQDAVCRCSPRRRRRMPARWPLPSVDRHGSARCTPRRPARRTVRSTPRDRRRQP